MNVAIVFAVALALLVVGCEVSGPGVTAKVYQTSTMVLENADLPDRLQTALEALAPPG